MQTILDLQTLEKHLSHIPLSALLEIDSAYWAEQSDRPPSLPAPGKSEEPSGPESNVNEYHDAKRSETMPKTSGTDSNSTRKQVRDWTIQAFESCGNHHVRRDRSHGKKAVQAQGSPGTEDPEAELDQLLSLLMT